jgi:hypothetical protein
MKAAIIQSNYLPWKGYFDIIHDADIFCFYDEMKYTKNDWRNRNKIYSKNGLHWLTIPIYKDAVKQRISEVSLEDSSWQHLHYTTLFNSYSKAPYFSQLEFFLNDFYRDHTWQYLSELNQYTIKKIAVYLGIKTKFVNSKDFSLTGDRIERLVNLLKNLGATEYISGPAAKDYLKGSEHLFEENNITLTFKDYSGYPPYKQLSEPFENYVSIIDTIANVEHGKISSYIFKS